MITECTVSFSAELGYSKLFADFINGQGGAAQLFAHNNLHEALARIRRSSYQRTTIVEILHRQNLGWGAGPAILSNIDKLKDDNAVIVATGQQACLFGGPYMVILKALGAIHRARDIQRQCNVPVVPLFWIAADDHDFEEISFAHLFDRQRKLAKISVSEQSNSPAFPIGALAYDDSIDAAVRQAVGILPDNDFKEENGALLERHYRPGVSIADAFAGMMIDLVGKYGLVLFNPYDEQFKQATVPIMADIVAQQAEIKDALSAQEQRLLASDYHIQAVKADTAAHMFIAAPTRTAVHMEADYFRAGESIYSEEELITAIAKSPLDFSPDVLTRLIVQSAVFPVAEFIGGPAELAYFAQMRPLFELLEVPAPMASARPSATIIEAAYQKTIEDFRLTYKNYTVNFAETYGSAMEETFPRPVEEAIEARRTAIHSEYRLLSESLIAFDGNLKEVVFKTGERIDFQIAELGRKVFAAHKKQNKIIKEKLDRLHEAVYPERSPAERIVSIVHFLSRYGLPVIDFLHHKLTHEQTGHQLLYLSESDE